MKKTLIALTCSSALLSGCQMITETETVTKTQYSDLWTSAEVAADDSIQTPTPEMVNPDTDPNRILTSKTETGNREYLFADSIKQENGTIVALVEYRYAQPQKLPSNGLTYTHNHWFEQIDCANNLRTIRTTTHYNAQGEIVDANEYPIAKLTPAQMKLLAQPDDGVIKEVCKRVNMDAGKVATPPPVVTTPQEVAPPPAMPASGTVAPPTPNVDEKQPENAPNGSVPENKAADKPAQPETKPEVKPEKTNKKSADKATKGKAKDDEVPVKTDIDFIQKDKAKNAPVVPQMPEITEEDLHRPALPADAPDDVNAPDKSTLQPKSNGQDDLPADFWEIGAPVQN